MYRALEIAKYIISQCMKLRNPISNLKLQKMLYFIWIDYYKETGKYLFDDDICAWQLGPVVPEVYYEFCSYAGIPIMRDYDIDLQSKDRKIVDRAIENYMPISANRLVNMTHKEGTPWSFVYNDGLGIRNVIPFPLIIKMECS